MSYIGHKDIEAVLGEPVGGHIGHIGHIGWGSQWAAAAFGEETYLAFFGRRSPWRKPTWPFLGALGRTTGFFGARGGLLWGEPTWLFGSPHRGLWGVRRTLPQRFGAFTWCLHLVPSLGAFTWCLRRNVPSSAQLYSGSAHRETQCCRGVTIFWRAALERLGCVSGDSPHTALVGLHLVKAASVEGDRLVVHVDPRAPQLLSVALRNSHFRRRAIVVFHPDPSSREGSESDRVVRLADHV